MEKLFPREIVTDIEEWLKKKEIIILYGARQVGKTCIMKLLIRKLKPDEFLYLDLEDTYNLHILSSVDTFLDYINSRALNKRKKVKVFIDEFQYLPQPSKFLKIIHDHYPKIKLIVSGSSSFEIRKKIAVTLTGRKIVFTIHTLNFKEYLTFKQNEYLKIKSDISIIKIVKDFNKFKKYNILSHKILPLVEDFMIYGGYPLPTLTKETKHKIMRLREIHNTYILKDIKDLASIDNIVEFNKLVSFLSVQLGGLLNLNNVCKEIGITRRYLEKFIFILEKTFVLKLLKPFFTNKQKELTKMPKVYFNDTGLRNVNINDFRSLDIRQDKGTLAENIFFHEISKRIEPFQELFYWRTKQHHEVDFIIMQNRKPIPIEIKYQKFRKPELSSSIRFFIEKFSPPYVIIITQDFLYKMKFKNTNVFFIPLWMV